ncbi:helix-hairpin-helix domain-containing protein [Spirosoma montaniterrae]|uniref:helix-hairpin-helix domain-containing protein n=1 Tax=Spirosoma montaniterrae TaxID=1178516 RepID=UPI00097D5B84|nr:helix-hairpin-helix domain-containing protein [Spirosoma montaniterrae]
MSVQSNDDEPAGDVLNSNTTYDIVVSPTGLITELSDTVDAMDGAEVEVVEIVNEADGTNIELTIIEEPTNQPGVTSVDRFIEIEGIGHKVAEMLTKAGILKFSQLAETPIERIREILAASGTFYRIYDATHWQNVETQDFASQSQPQDFASQPQPQDITSSRATTEPKPTDDQPRSNKRE